MLTTGPGKQPAARSPAGLDPLGTNPLLTPPHSPSLSFPGPGTQAGQNPGPSPHHNGQTEGVWGLSETGGDRGHMREKQMPRKYLDTFKSPEGQTPKRWSVSTVPYNVWGFLPKKYVLVL